MPASPALSTSPIPPIIQTQRSKRSVDGLLWAQLSDTSPHSSSTRGMTAAQKAGLAFEKKIGRQLRQYWGKAHLPGPWIEFEDDNGPGRAQPDHVIVDPLGRWNIIIECKLSYFTLAECELSELYHPLVTHVFPDRDTYLYLTFHHPAGFSGPSISRASQLLSFGPPQKVHHWHSLR